MAAKPNTQGKIRVKVQRRFFNGFGQGNRDIVGARGLVRIGGKEDM